MLVALETHRLPSPTGQEARDRKFFVWAKSNREYMNDVFKVPIMST